MVLKKLINCVAVSTSRTDARAYAYVPIQCPCVDVCATVSTLTATTDLFSSQDYSTVDDFFAKLRTMTSTVAQRMLYSTVLLRCWNTNKQAVTISEFTKNYNASYGLAGPI
jgi:hypothetical protein